MSHGRRLHEAIRHLFLCHDTDGILASHGHQCQTRLRCLETVLHLVQPTLRRENGNVVIIVSIKIQRRLSLKWWRRAKTLTRWFKWMEGGGEIIEQRYYKKAWCWVHPLRATQAIEHKYSNPINSADTYESRLILVYYYGVVDLGKKRKQVIVVVWFRSLLLFSSLSQSFCGLPHGSIGVSYPNPSNFPNDGQGGYPLLGAHNNWNFANSLGYTTFQLGTDSLEQSNDWYNKKTRDSTSREWSQA